ncbi:hypothetical protein [Vibrio splendidus]|nr:hypothetical protein [Vibrio splendidus]
MSTKSLKQIIDDMYNEEFENFSTYAFLELIARDMNRTLTIW